MADADSQGQSNVDAEQAGFASALVTGGLPFAGDAAASAGEGGSGAGSSSGGGGLAGGNKGGAGSSGLVGGFGNPAAAGRDKAKKNRNGIDAASNGRNAGHEDTENGNEEDQNEPSDDVDEGRQEGEAAEDTVNNKSAPQQVDTSTGDSYDPNSSFKQDQTKAKEKVAQNKTGGAAADAPKSAENKVAGAAAKGLANEASPIDAQQAEQGLKKAASGDLEGAAEELVGVADKAATKWLFVGMIALVIPTFGLVIVFADLVLLFAILWKFITGRSIFQLDLWQKMTMVGLNIVLLFAILLIITLIDYMLCHGINGALTKAASAIGFAPDICKVFGN